MRLRSHLLAIVSAATLIGFVGANALAQGTPSTPSDKSGQSSSAPSSPSTKSTPGAQTSGSQTTTKGAAADAPSSGPWTADNVTAARPFGSIDITPAGTTSQSVSAWAQQRTPAERAELTGRCEIITNAQNSSRFMADAVAFCRSYMMVASANPPAGKASGKATP